MILLFQEDSSKTIADTLDRIRWFPAMLAHNLHVKHAPKVHIEFRRSLKKFSEVSKNDLRARAISSKFWVRSWKLEEVRSSNLEQKGNKKRSQLEGSLHQMIAPTERCL